MEGRMLDFISFCILPWNVDGRQFNAAHTDS